MRRYLSTLLALCLCCGMLAGCGGKESGTNDSNALAVQQSRELSFHGYYFEVPESWEEGDLTDDELYFFPETGMAMMKYSPVEGADILNADVQKEFISGLEQGYEEFELLDESIIKTGGQEAYQLTMNLKSNDTDYKGTMVTFNALGGWMTFAMFEVRETGETYSDEFEKILSSIRNENNFTGNEGSIQNDAENIMDRIEVKAVPTKDGLMCAFITNNSDTVVDELGVQINYLDENGTTIDLDEDGHDMVLPGSTVVSRLDAPESYADYQIGKNVELGVNPRYQNHAKNVGLNANQGEECIIVEITNNSDVSIDEIEYIAVLYQGDDIVTVEYPEDVYDVEPGQMITEKINTRREEYDRFEVYLNQAHTFGF